MKCPATSGHLRGKQNRFLSGWLYGALLFFAVPLLVLAEDREPDAPQFLSQLPKIRQDAEAGDMDKQNYLAILYIAGVEGKRDYTKGIYWLKKAAAQDSVFAETLLAFIYIEGLEGEQNWSEAAYWARRSARHNNYAGQLLLGALYEVGAGVGKSEQSAVEWYEKSARYEKDMGARYKMGMMYLEGRGVEKNVPQAENWLMRAAEKGDAHACYQLGMMYYEGKDVKQDYRQALDWFGRAAAIGVQHSRVLKEVYGEAYVPGEEYSKTVGTFLKRDPLVRANASYMLGRMSEAGMGTEKDAEKARYYYTRAADLGHTDVKARSDDAAGESAMKPVQKESTLPKEKPALPQTN